MGYRFVALVALMLAGCGGESLGDAEETGGALATGGEAGEASPTGGAVESTGGTPSTGGMPTGGSSGTGGQGTGGSATGGSAGQVTPGGEAGSGGDGSCLPSAVEPITCPDGSEGQRICHYTGTRWTVMCPDGAGGAATGGNAGAAGIAEETGGSETGGASTGGTATGGTTGGSDTGGLPTGGASTGGTPTGGVATGGTTTGGASTGGAPPIGAGHWVIDGTCVRLEPEPCVDAAHLGERCGHCGDAAGNRCSEGGSCTEEGSIISCVECSTSLNCDGLDSNGCEAGGDGETCEEILSPGHEACAWGYFGIDHFGEPCGDTCYACVPVC